MLQDPPLSPQLIVRFPPLVLGGTLINFRLKSRLMATLLLSPEFVAHTLDPAMVHYTVGLRAFYSRLWARRTPAAKRRFWEYANRA